jgi:hypothetical protein
MLQIGLGRREWADVAKVQEWLEHANLGDTALVDGENFDLMVARQDSFTRGSADQSPRDGRDVRY